MNTIPIIYIVYLLLHKVQSKVDFFGVMEEFQNVVKVTFNCYFSTGSHDCSAEFLRNKETIDNLRASNDICYHKHNLCRPDTCVCSKDCKRYILMFTNMFYTAGDIFGCEVHYKDAGNIVRMTSEILFNGSDFIYHNTTSCIVAQPDKDSSSTKPPDTNSPISKDEIFIGALFVLLAVIAICFIVFLVKKRRNTAALRRRNNFNTMLATRRADGIADDQEVQLRVKAVHDESHDDHRNSGDPLTENRSSITSAMTESTTDQRNSGDLSDGNRASIGSAITETTTVDRLSSVSIPAVDDSIENEDTAL